MGQLRPLFNLFSTFQAHLTNLTTIGVWKNVHPVYSAGIRTHDFWNMSPLQSPLDQGSCPLLLLLLLFGRTWRRTGWLSLKIFWANFEENFASISLAIFLCWSLRQSEEEEESRRRSRHRKQKIRCRVSGAHNSESKKWSPNDRKFPRRTKASFRLQPVCCNQRLTKCIADK